MQQSSLIGGDGGSGAGSVGDGIAKLIIEHSPQGIVLLDQSQRIAIANPAFSSMLGYAPDELVNHRFQNLLSAEEAGTVRRMIDRSAYGERPDRIAPVQYLHKLGRLVPGAFSVSGSIASAANIQYSILSIEDLSRHYQRQSRISEQAEKIRALEREKVLSEVASGIAHEINQPLTAISAYAQSCLNLLDRGDWQPLHNDLRQVLTRLSEQVARAGSVTDQVRALGRGRPPKNEAFNCNELVRVAIDLVTKNTYPRSFVVTTDFADNLPQLYFDPVHVLLILVCLIRNAMDSIRSKNGSSNHRLKLLTRRVSRAYVSISVVDSGWGVEDAVADLLFLPYSTTREENIGMGLAVCRSIADACGAELSYFNNSTGGATFSLLLPIGQTN